MFPAWILPLCPAVPVPVIQYALPCSTYYHGAMDRDRANKMREDTNAEGSFFSEKFRKALYAIADTLGSRIDDDHIVLSFLVLPPCTYPHGSGMMIIREDETWFADEVFLLRLLDGEEYTLYVEVLGGHWPTPLVVGDFYGVYDPLRYVTFFAVVGRGSKGNPWNWSRTPFQVVVKGESP